MDDLAKDILALPSGIHYVNCHILRLHGRAFPGDLIRYICPRSGMRHWRILNGNIVEYFADKQVCIIIGCGLGQTLFARLQARHGKLVVVIHAEDNEVGIRVLHGDNGFYLSKDNADKTPPFCQTELHNVRNVLHKEIEERRAILADIDDIILELNPPPSKRPLN